jgi:cytidylate kinase
MNPRSLLERLGEPLLRSEYLPHRGEAGQAPAPEGFTIALSREVGALGTTVAKAVGQRLGWTVYDHELVERVARDMNLRTQLLESLDERLGDWVADCFRAFSSKRVVSEFDYVEHLVQTLLGLAARGQCVIVGRGAALVLPGDRVLRVRLVAPPEFRIETIARQLGAGHDAALRHIERTEHARTAFIKAHFRKDPKDPVNFDLLVNTGTFTAEEAADLIVAALGRLQARVAGAG